MLSHRYLVLCLMLLLTSCQTGYLNIQTQYLSYENSASYRVNTPDPKRDQPTFGQRLMITWTLSNCFGKYQTFSLNLKVRFKNHQEEEICISIENPKGTYIYNLLQTKYVETGGIATYKAELLADGQVIDYWIHPLWTKLITFKSEPT